MKGKNGLNTIALMVELSAIFLRPLSIIISPFESDTLELWKKNREANISLLSSESLILWTIGVFDTS